MNKLLVICGPTATGKTALALNLATKFNGELISADSRQVYKGMDIGTGKDLPANFKFQISKFKFNGKRVGYFSDGKTRIWGLDLVNPNEPFSVADYLRFVLPLIKQLWQEDKLPIVVGGTGFYIRALTNYLPNVFVKQNQSLRQELHKLQVYQLQERLQKQNPKRFQKMNMSDRANPRRLVRAIEIAEDKQETTAVYLSEYKKYMQQLNVLKIGLRATQDIIFEKIDKRVNQRIKQGMIKEVKRLVAKNYLWNLPAMSSLGYKEWKPLFEKSRPKADQPLAENIITAKAGSRQSLKFNEGGKNQISKINTEKLVVEIINLWKLHEKQYFKRQLTWFAKEKNIEWFDTEDIDFLKKAAEYIGKWVV